MMTPNTLPFNAEGALNAYSIAKAGASGGVLQAAAATDKILGVTTEIASATNDRCDVQVDGVVLVKSGGTIAQGDFLTSDASGNAVTAAPGAGTNNRLVGIAVEAAVSGDIFRVKLQPSSLQG